MQSTSIEEERDTLKDNVIRSKDTVMSETNDDLTVGENHELIPKPAAKKQAPPNKQRTNGMKFSFYAFAHYKI